MTLDDRLGGLAVGWVTESCLECRRLELGSLSGTAGGVDDVNFLNRCDVKEARGLSASDGRLSTPVAALSILAFVPSMGAGVAGVVVVGGVGVVSVMGIGSVVGVVSVAGVGSGAGTGSGADAMSVVGMVSSTVAGSIEAMISSVNVGSV